MAGDFVTRGNRREFSDFFSAVLHDIWYLTSGIDGRGRLKTDIKKVIRRALQHKFQKGHPDRKHAITAFVRDVYDALHPDNSVHDRKLIFDSWSLEYNPYEGDIDGDRIYDMFRNKGGKDLYDKFADDDDDEDW